MIEMPTTLERAKELKQALQQFVYDAEGDLAVSLETYSAEQLSRLAKSQYQDTNQTTLLIDRFLSEGKVGDRLALDLFIESQPELAEVDRDLIIGWQRGFVGLFAVTEILVDGFELMNWLTAKHYIVKPNGLQPPEKLARLKVGEIILTQILPVTDAVWMFSDALTLMGKLGKPKLAIAIRNFKQSYKEYLYRDAPELLEEAWHSVEQYHQEFIDFFGSDEVTLPGYEANQKLKELQKISIERRFKAAGMDGTKSLTELVEESGIDREELIAAMGAEVEPLFDRGKTQTKKKPVMPAPQIDLPEQLRKAEQLTMLTHPRWGQMFLVTYHQLKTLLETDDDRSVEDIAKLLRQYLEEPEINAFIWHHLARQYPSQMTGVVQKAFDRPNFEITQDLDALLQEFGKPLTPDLPEIASVPLHLHNLFQEAMLEVSKSQPKPKSKQKVGSGFQR